MNVDIAILAGGAGTRLWPASHKGLPKQFLKLPSDKSLIEQAVARARLFVNEDRIWIVTLESQLDQTRNALPDFSTDHIVCEPVARNSGPAAALATLHIQNLRKEATTILLTPADHFIPMEDEFTKTIQTGLVRAQEGASIVTFGLHVASPRTDFGYIETQGDVESGGYFKAKRFVEKPPLEKAQAYMASGAYFWNSGIFAWRSDYFLSELKRHAPDIHAPLLSNDHSLADAYESVPNISVDYALVEKTDRVDVVPSKFKWSDLGTWSAVYEAASSGSESNAVLSPGSVVDGEGCLTYSSQKPIYVYGVNDLVVVETEEATLVTSREKSLKLKTFLEKIKK